MADASNAPLGPARPWAAWSMLGPAALGLVDEAATTEIYTLALALSQSTLGRPLAAWAGLAQFQHLLRDSVFFETLLRTGLYAVPSSLIQLALGLGLALLLQGVRQGRWLSSLILLPLMTPPVLVGVAWKLLLAPAGGLFNGWLLHLGVLDAPLSVLGSDTWALPAVVLADTWQWLPFVVILCLAALQTLPSDVHEAARLEGASELNVFVHISLPQLAPSLLGIFLLREVMALKTFDVVYILTAGGPGRSTTLASYEIWKTGLHNFDIGLAAAQTLLFSLFVGLVTWPVLKALQWVERRTG